MWTDWIPAAVVVALITVAGTVYGIKQNRKTAAETNHISESEIVISALQEQVKNLTDRADKSDAKMADQSSKIDDMRSQIRRLSDSEWSLRRYVTILVDFIRKHDLDPPDPPDFPQ